MKSQIACALLAERVTGGCGGPWPAGSVHPRNRVSCFCKLALVTTAR
jgi:hypothetical protein